MKTITVTSVTYNAGLGTISISGTVADQTFSQPAQQTTINRNSPNNSLFTRALRIIPDAIFCLRNGSNTVALLSDSWTKIAVALEPTLSWVPRFSTDNTPQSIALGGTGSFAVVQNVSDELSATFQWKRSADGGVTWVNITGGTTPNDGCTYSNYTTATLGIATVVVGMNGYLYKCTATNGAGSSDSAACALTISAAAPTIGTNPTNQSCVHNSTTATFTVVASGTSLTYQWQVSLDGSTGWTNLTESSLGAPTPYSNTQTASMTVTPVTTSQNGYYYRCVVTNAAGSANSTAAQLTVT